MGRLSESAAGPEGGGRVVKAGFRFMELIIKAYLVVLKWILRSSKSNLDLKLACVFLKISLFFIDRT